MESAEPVRALVLTFNKTLRGYIKNLVEENVPAGKIELTVDTFRHWAYLTLGGPSIHDESHLTGLVGRHAAVVGFRTGEMLFQSQFHRRRSGNRSSCSCDRHSLAAAVFLIMCGTPADSTT